MRLLKLSLRTRIFISMTILVLLASILIAAVTIYQYKEEAEEYHQGRLERKEERIQITINNVLKRTTYPVNKENIALIFREKDRIYQISEEHSMPINIYGLTGKLLVKSEGGFAKDTTDIQINPIILDTLASLYNKKYLVKSEKNGERFLTSYTYITDVKSKPLGILHLPYLEDDDLITRELLEFLQRLGQVYLLMLLVAIVLAYFLSKYITRSLKTISETIDQTRLDKRNKRIDIGDASEEIYSLVNAYNSMIDELEQSAAMLAKSEREAAWREMAKQVAHEIKNPLTPMRLTVQSFQRKFDPNDPKIQQKVQEYSDTLIQQIDTMSSIASAFSNFAQMPAQKSETLDVVKIIGLALDIFNEDYIIFPSEKEKIIAKFDRTQLIRVVTNLVKNGIQAIPEDRIPKIIVDVFSENGEVLITVADNGIGITEENTKKVFEPKFTTKTSGMGLGLGMVKNIVETYNGSITFTSKEGKGTVFKVRFPKE
ncbi:signal transduction histidine kinase [Aquimarina sp. EL_43]|uniref:sensor histidine kinase n=1 Tax=Aquimarina TaxID=290174 RepID=UPI00047135BE|nr:MULTISPECIES: ATP-binding protein [Aquimarina]MBG6131520.1 signal transduction histidine kinase [Aquimarina sp. EL_35]MBG6151980.1 signal transduction histidine kinase [Aquimarina sp. EL_32]MBG6170076.1 signal transduction histidine kinase [Aquimarina sp. EL_43]